MKQVASKINELEMDSLKIKLENIEIKHNDLFNTSLILENDVTKLKQSYFTSSNGVVITDNRQYGMDTIDISLDPNFITRSTIDVMEADIHELKKTVKLLSQYIYDMETTKPKITKV